MTKDTTTRDLLFSSQCFSSPIVHPSYPDFKIPPAWYSPFINAMLLPNYKNPGLRWANILSEYPHRWLDISISMCLLRYFAGLVYDAIFNLILDKDAKSITEEKYLGYRNSIEDVIDEYFKQIAPLQEAYALFWAVTVLQTIKDPGSKFLESKYIEGISWNNLDGKTRRIYSELVDLSDYIGGIALSSITGALNISWPDMPARNSSDQEHYVKLRNTFINHIKDSSNNPILRFRKFNRIVKSAIKRENMAQIDPEEGSIYLYDNIPELRTYFIDPCSHSCVCQSILDGILEDDPKSPAYSPFFWAVSLSRKIREDFQVESETEAPLDSQIKLVRRKQPRSLPYLLFVEDRCHVQPNVPDVSMVARLAVFESIRQQENQIIRRGRRKRLKLRCPWESIKVFEDEEPSCLEMFDAEADWNRKLFADYWRSVQRFGFNILL